MSFKLEVTDIFTGIVESYTKDTQKECEDLISDLKIEWSKVGSVDNYTLRITDESPEAIKDDLRSKLIATGLRNETACRNCLRIIGGYNNHRDLTLEQIMAMAANFSTLETCLNRGMASTAKQLISAIKPDGAIVTEDLRGMLLDELKEF